MPASRRFGDSLAAAIGLAGGLGAWACAPVFSDMQSARTLPRGRTEITPYVTGAGFDDDDETEHVQNQLGVQVGWGLGDNVELRGRGELVVIRNDDSTPVGVVALGPKLALIADRLAAYLPIGFAFGSGADVLDSLTMQPTLLATFPVGRHVEINTSGRLNWTLRSETFRGVGLGVGLGLGPRDGPWTIRPEAGVLFAERDVRYWQASLGVSLRPQ